MIDDPLSDVKRKLSVPVPTQNVLLDAKNVVVAKARATAHWVTQSIVHLVQSHYSRLGWILFYVIALTAFLLYRCTALYGLNKMYGTTKHATGGVVVGALSLGFLEDFVCTTYFACFLWLYDTLAKAYFTPHSRSARLAMKGLKFTVSWLLFLAMMVPFVADAVIVRLRYIRFTFDLVSMAIEEKDHIAAVAVSSSETTDAYVNVAAVVAVATLFAIVRTWAPWANLSNWNPTLLCIDSQEVATSCSPGLTESQDLESPNEKVELVPMHNKLTKSEEHVNSSQYAIVAIDEDSEVVNGTCDKVATRSRVNPSGGISRVFCTRSLKLLMLLFSASMVVVALSRATTPLIAYAALNTTLNELLQHVLEPAMGGSSAFGDADRLGVESFIDSNEERTLYGNRTLYRRTTGFRGDLAFNVSVSDLDPPNVIVIAVESFRFHDSHYLVGDEDPSNLFKGSNITVTPSFDKWAKRGIALRNYWSSWRTSRSVESLMFGQLPYDSVTRSGTTGGQRGTTLSGLPQLFKAKDYETFFTTGCVTDYDTWDFFLPAHGFDTVWSRDKMEKLAQSDLGIKPSDWEGPEHRALDWGVHDDLTFQLLGDLLVNKTKAQRSRMAKGEAKKPLFLNHYTISSHVNYKQRPKWYEEAEKPDFSALYRGQKYAHNIKNYLEMRYFTDLEFGKFMARMAETGVLNDTIVVISGDHGQGPEYGNNVPEDRDVSATRVAGAIVAEGRLGDAVGMVIDDATEQYDILNTLADITGVPEGGFEQDGVGRSLKREIKFGQRVVYSNNPTRKMSVVRGHLRLRYDKLTDSMLLHDVDKDHDMSTDLLPELAAQERSEWMKWRDAGRQINAYYTERWVGKCLLTADC
ncbi:Sulfatase [Phytophthora infestans]|uniref:Sulfatase n=1 Tax=Phytophthora infestans TaxID=4787 RepID=A0A833WJH0_PHYIN|nr:Sulfatase [Phytophthora infestans]